MLTESKAFSGFSVDDPGKARRFYEDTLGLRVSDLGAWMLGPGSACRDSVLIPVEANGSPAFAQYKPAEGGGRLPWALHELEVSGGRIAHITSFLDLDDRLFRQLGLPARME